MVFCGKPSRACQPCRTKRRRCDLATPSCNQCLRAHVKCHGYRDTSLISFRDETATVSCKARRKIENSRKGSGELAQIKTNPCSRSRTVSTSFPISTLFPDDESLAVRYFLGSYVVETTYSYLPLFWNTFADDSMAYGAMLAMATASFAHTLRNPRLLEQARRQYSVALAATNKALSRSDCVIEDNVLLCVLLLAMYEALTFRGRMTPKDWIMHVNGLAIILKLRGSHQSDHIIGEYLTRHASAQIMTYCLSQHVSIPEHVHEVQRYQSKNGLNDYHADLSVLLHGCTALRSKMRGMLATDVVRECLRLDQVAQDGMTAFYISQPYTVLNSNGIGNVVEYERDKIHNYASQNAVRRWNNLRVARVALNEWIYCAANSLRGVVLDTPEPEDPMHGIWYDLPRVAAETFDMVVEDILASITYSRGCLGSSPSTGARFLLWPLTAAAASELCSQRTKDFIIGQLKQLSTKDHVEQAMEAATMLEEGTNMEDWLNVYQFS